MFYKTSLCYSIMLPDITLCSNHGMMFSWLATVEFYPHDFFRIIQTTGFVYCDLYDSFVIVLLYSNVYTTFAELWDDSFWWFCISTSHYRYHVSFIWGMCKNISYCINFISYKNIWHIGIRCIFSLLHN